MAINWTAEQSAAIDHRGSTLLVSAAAGSGKTAVLVERLLRRVADEKCDITSFLMITYTNAAAAELRAKIISALTDRVTSSPRDEHLRRQLTLAHSAHISTVHSFCMSLLRTHGHIIGLGADFRLMDESEGKTLRAQLCEEVLEECYGEDWFMPAAHAMFGDRDDRVLAETVLDLHDRSRSQVFPQKWLERLGNDYCASETVAAENTRWGAYILKLAGASLENAENITQRAMAEMSGDEKLSKAYLPTFQDMSELISRLRSGVRTGWDAAVKEFSDISFTKLGMLRGYDDTEKKERIKKMRDAVKEKLDNMAKNWFRRGSEVLLSELSDLAPVAQGIIGAVNMLEQRFSAEKLRRGLMDYSDLEHYALKLLVESYDSDSDTLIPTAAAREISRDWTEIMVDEYQDSNCIQDVIFRAISREEKNIVMVGDIKQSIYRFRLADPQIFLRKYRSFKPKEEAADGEACRVKLSCNFRSRCQVLDACNSLFERIMSDELGDIEYTHEEFLNPGAEYTEYPEQSNAAEAVVLDFGAMDKAEDTGASQSRREVEAEWIAKRLSEMMESGFSVQDKDGGRRRMRWSDVVILMRSISANGYIYETALQRAGIPCVSDKAGGLLDAPEISMVISMLTVIDNPLNDVALVGALRSPLFAFTADDLSRVKRKSGSFIAAVEIAARGQDETAEKCRRFLKVLYSLRENSEDMSCDRLIWQMYCDTSALGLVGALPGGASRRDNLLRFYEYARGFEQGGYRGLYAFLERIAHIAERGENIPASPASVGDAVRIMTIHKSKGLEFPVVILADFDHEFNRADAMKKVIVHPELGLGIKACRSAPRSAHPTLARTAIECMINREMKSEEMRVLYVALTRAREKLIIVCTASSAESTLSGLYVRTAGDGKFSAEELDAQKPVPWLIAPLMYSAEGSELREYIGAPRIPGAYSMNMQVSLVVPNANSRARVTAVCEEKCAHTEIGSAEDFKKKFEYVYPHEQAAQAPSKITATGMRTMQLENTIDAEGIPEPEVPRGFARPEFVRESGLTPAEKGIAAHLAMQLMDFSRCADIEGVTEELSRLHELGQLSDAEYGAVKPELLWRFFESEIGRQALSAEKLWREFRFSLLIPADHMAPGEKMLLQGVADLFFETPDGIVLVDFKTDSSPDPEKAIKRYSGQMAAYAHALEEICGIRACRKVLFLLHFGRSIILD